MKEYLQKYIDGQVEVLKKTDTELLSEVCDMLLEARKTGHSIYFAGNGGSAATASHFTNDMVKGLSVEGKKRFRCFSLVDQVPVITALANDYSYDDIFSEQLKNYGKANDILFAISGSGNSKNILKGLSYAKSIGMKTIGFSGRDGGKMKELCDICVIAGTWGMEQLEDMHMVWEHAIICTLKNEIEKED
ncbi:MAG: SIS domain-containing protein [Clostridia bacterium]|nr:SIS domain-containing protein [Clostridia bacterium]